MKTRTLTFVFRSVAVSLVLTTVAGCNVFTRLSEVGEEPRLSGIENPVATPSYQPVSMPMPAPQAIENNPNSLWRNGAKAFFKDHRAADVGDIITVQLDISDSAVLENNTERDRDDGETSNLNDLLGFEDELSKVLPEGIDSPGQIVDFNSTHSTSGDGTIDRSETISLNLAAVVTQVLPNGNLVVLGRQEIRVNSELRELMITGIVRPSDIDTNNSINHTQIAEMRVAYGGRGTLSGLQQPRWGMQVWDILFPF